MSAVIINLPPVSAWLAYRRDPAVWPPAHAVDATRELHDLSPDLRRRVEVARGIERNDSERSAEHG